ncbi:APC amino acid permease [Cubamyces sp. BRFM 1775]|nr:APC amino acid permease [Cubamyces sp. BRFM 1775]
MSPPPSIERKSASSESRVQVSEVPVGLSEADGRHSHGATRNDGEIDRGSVESDSDNAVLAALGYKQEFKRAFTPFETLSLSFTTIGLFPSVATVLVFALSNGGPVALVWGWAICTFFLTFALALSELGSAAPTSGGLYYWTWDLSSPKWRKVLAWLVGYTNSMGLIAGFASLDWGCAVQIMAAASIGSDGGFVPTTANTLFRDILCSAVFVALICVQGFLASMATRILARLQGLYAALNVLLPLAIIIALPAATPKEYRNTASYVFSGFENLNGWPDGFAFVLSFLAPLFVIAGFDSPVHISEESHNARTAVPWAITGAVATGGVLGWVVMLVIAFCMGSDIGSILANPIGQPMATILFNSFGRDGTLAVWSVIVFVQFLMGANALMVASRQLFAFARDRAAPFSRFIYRVNRRTRTPVNAVWCAAFVALLLGLLVFAGPATYSAIFGVALLGQYTAFSIPMAARFLGGKEWHPGPFTLGRFGLPVAVLAVLWMMFSTVILTFPTSPGPDKNTMNYTAVVYCGWVGLCLLYYYLPVYGGACWFNGPQRTVDEAGLPSLPCPSPEDAVETKGRPSLDEKQVA